MNFTNFVSTIAIVFAVGCSSSTEVPAEVQGTAEVVVEPVSVETTPVVNETATSTSTDTTQQTPGASVVTCPEGSTLVEGVCQTSAVETTTSSH